MHFKQFHFFKRDLQKGPKCYEKMHGLGIIQKVQQYLKLVRIFWRNCLEFCSFQINGDIHNVHRRSAGTYKDTRTGPDQVFGKLEQRQYFFTKKCCLIDINHFILKAEITIDMLKLIRTSM